MYLDSPMQYVGVLFENILYGNQPAGWEIIGTKENILSFERKNFIDYLKNHYSSQNTIVCISGNFNQGKATSFVKKSFKSINKTRLKTKLKQKSLKMPLSPWFILKKQTKLIYVWA